MSRTGKKDESFLFDCFEAGVANPRFMASVSCIAAVAAVILNWLWKPLGPLTPVLVFLLWLMTAFGIAGTIKGYFVKKARQKMLDKTEELTDLKAITWQQFEQLVADAYRAQGYKVEERGGVADGGIDLILHASDGRKIGVQCKRWKEWQVGAPRIREFVGAIQQERLDGGIFVASGTYSRPAVEAAAKTKILLIDGSALLELIKSGRRVA